MNNMGAAGDARNGLCGCSHVIVGGAMRYKYPPGVERLRPQPQPKMKRPTKLPSLASKKMKAQATESSLQEDEANIQQPRRLRGRPGLTSREWQQLNENIKNNLPKLTSRDVRRRSIPYHEAVFLELQEDDFLDSYSFLQALVAYNEAIYSEFNENSLSLQPSLLRENPVCLDRLREGIQEGEVAKKKGHPKEEISILMNTAIFFMQKTEDWWWLARQLFEKCVQVGSIYRGDGGKSEAHVRFVYGVFMFEKVQDLEEARLQLEVVRRLSNGKSWKANEVSAESKDTLFGETNRYLYLILMQQARALRDHDPQLSARLGHMAVRRAAESTEVTAPGHVLYEVACSFVAAKEYRMALNVFKVYLHATKTESSVGGLCSAFRNMGLCYSKLNDKNKARTFFEVHLNVAKKQGSTPLMADAYRYFGDFLLSMDLPSDAASRLVSSFELYSELKDEKQHEKELSRILLAIANGHEMLPNYARAILQGDIMRLANWKSRRIPYWDKEKSEDEVTENPESEESETSDDELTAD